MITLRNDQLATLARDGARRARQALAQQLNEQGFDATYEAATESIVVRDAAGGIATIECRDNGVIVRSGEGRRFGFWFDDRQRLQCIVHPDDQYTTFVHDDGNRLVAVRRGAHSAWEFELHDSGGPLAVSEPDDRTTRFTYDELGRVISVEDPRGGVTDYEYAHAGYPRRVTDPTGSTTLYEYAENGALAGVQEPSGSQLRYHGDDDGQIVALERDGTPVARFASEDAATDRVDYPDGAWTRLRTAEGRLVEATNESCALTLTYDSEGRLVGEDTDGRVVRYVRDAVGMVTAIVTPDGEQIQFERDSEHRLRRVLDWSGAAYELAYEMSGAVAQLDYPNGVRLFQHSTTVGLTASLLATTPASDEPLLDVRWDYDVCDRLIAETRPDGRCQFAYDPCGRLTRVTTNSGTKTFELDGVGNRLADGKHRCEYNRQHQLLRRGEEAYTYDAHGNMVAGASPAGAVRCVYNRRGELIEARNRVGSTRYAYDPLGRRIRKERDGRVTRYIWAGAQLLGEVTDEQGVTRRRDYLIAPDVSAALAIRNGDEVSYLHHGRRHEPLVATNQHGAVIWRAEYGACGTAHIVTARIEQPFRLLGQYFDEETGLHYQVRRYYDPEVGRFLTPDPLGFSGGGFNPYLFADGDPLNQADPTGEVILLAMAAGAVIGAGIGAGVAMWKQRNEPKFDWGTIGKEALIGGVIGALGGGLGAALVPAAGALGTGLLAVASGGFLVGGATAAVETCAESLMREGHWPGGGELAQGALIGAAIGAVTAGAGGILRRLRRPFTPAGLSKKARAAYMKSSAGKKLLKEVKRGRPGDNAHAYADGLLKSGSTPPSVRSARRGEKMYKVVPSGTKPDTVVKNKSPYFVSEDELRQLKANPSAVDDRLSLPRKSAAPEYDVYEVKPRSSKAKVFESEVAPAGEGVNNTSGGGQQSILPNRGDWTDPKPVGKL